VLTLARSIKLEIINLVKFGDLASSRLLARPVTGERLFNPFVIAGLVILSLWMSVVWLRWQSAPFVTVDWWDSSFVWIKLLAETGSPFAAIDGTVPNVMGGIPRATLGSDFNLLVLATKLLGPFTAFALSDFVVHFVAFFGMYLLLSKWLLKTGSLAIVVSVALLFALVPQYPYYGIGIAGQPLLIYSFLNIKHRRSRKLDWLIVGLFPFYSVFTQIGVFLIGVIGS
jgi:hypothetical protein